MATVWIVPLPFFSHVMCSAQLSELLAKNGLSVTLFAATADLQRLRSIPMLENWKEQRLGINLQNLDITWPRLADCVDDSKRLIEPFVQTGRAFEEFLKNECTKGVKPTCVISDFMLHGVHNAAAEYKIPSWTFSPLPVGYIATFVHVKQLESKGLMQLPQDRLSQLSQQEFISPPGQTLLRICDLSPLFFRDGHLYQYGLQLLQPFLNADVILFSGFEEFEPQAVYELRRIFKAHASRKSKQIPHIWTIGPMFPLLSYSKRSKLGNTGGAEVHPCIKFLDSHPPTSVVYVAFGSDVNLSQQQIRELVYGLKSSQQPFLCVLNSSKEDPNFNVQVQGITSILPPECLECIKSRSLFLRWAPQQEVLSHPSVGAFISHCGFNSILESVSQGVPILAWPFKFEQFMNCRHLVDMAKVSLEICPGVISDGFVTRGDIERCINTLFRSTEGTAVREKAMQMKQRAEDAVRENGSSSENMKKLVELIRSLGIQDA